MDRVKTPDVFCSLFHWHLSHDCAVAKGVNMAIEFGCKGGSECSCVGQQKAVEDKNGITEQIESDNFTVFVCSAKYC